jgi:uncharacterized RDD family membrane protein YckC
MIWHYLENNVQKGPVTDEDLDALVRAGTLDENTLVWRDGMAGWLSYRQAKGAAAATSAAPPPEASAGQVVCAECGRAFAPDQVIRHGNAFICAACKPVFLQKIKEGVAVAAPLNYAGFWIRFGAYFIDSLLLEVVLVPLSFVIRAVVGAPANATQAGMTVLFLNTPVNLVIVVGYYTFLVGKYGATLGKMATKLRVVNPDGSPVGYGKACGRYLAQILSGMICLIGYLMVIWDPERRALHDRICATRVIRK